MKNLFSFLLSLALIAGIFVQNGNAQVTVSGSTGADATYTTLALAFTAINGTAQTGNRIVITITANTSETATATLNAGAWITLTIYPTTSGLSISGTIASGPLINLNGADNVTIDGRVNQSGAKSLTITNLSTSSGNNTSTIRFINDAINNQINYCMVKGASTSSTGGGIIYFAGTTGTDGNDDNTINNCDITGVTPSSLTNRPVNVIFSNGTAAKTNSGNTISNNNIYDFCNVTTFNGSFGIYIISQSNGWTISENSFYETQSIVPTQDVGYYVINIATGDGYTITGNYIGGSDALCGGTAWTKTNAKTNTFYAIQLSGGTTNESNIQGNTIKKFNYANAGASDWVGIYFYLGTINIGTTSGNTIGATTGTASITFTNGALGGYFYGIYCDEVTSVNIQNNSIGAITVANSDATANNSFYGIYKNASAGTSTISNNLIGSLTEANSINASSASTGSDQFQYVYGIFSAGTYVSNISNNMVSNLKNGTTHNALFGSTGRINGIRATAGANTITNNTVRDLTIANANSATNGSASVIGIVSISTTYSQNVSGNTIYNLSNTFASHAFAEGSVIGLYYEGINSGSNSISKNFIHSLSLSSTYYAARLYGIKIGSGATTYSNNIISLGTGLSTGYAIYGIYETGAATHNNNLYFNTVYIGGTPSGTTSSTYALYNAANTNTRNFRNNILYNARSGGSTGQHYAVSLAGTTGLTIDYNDYYAPGIGGVLGYNGGDKASLPIITGQDVHSLNTNPNFASAGGTTAANYSPLTTSLVAIAGTGVTTDYAGTTRSLTYPEMGAYEYAIPLPSWNGSTSTNWNTATNWYPNVVPIASDIATIPNVTNKPVVNEASGTPAVCNNLTIESGAVLTIAAGKALTVSGTLTNNSTGGVVIQSDATNTGSLITTTATGTGTATVQRYMAAASWRIATSPLAGQTIGGFLTANPTIATNIATPSLRGMTDYNIATNAWNSYFTNSEAASISVGKGYMLRAKSDGAGVVSFNGTLNAAATTVTLDNISGTKWNCVGNPFTSAITNSVIFTANSGVFESSYVALYVYNGASYDIVNLASDATTKTQAGQGFFVKAATTSLSFPINAKVHDNTTVLKSSSTNSEIKLIAGNGGKNAATSIKFIAGTSTGLDEGYDAGIFKSDIGLNLYTRLIEDNGIDFGLQCLPNNDFSSMVIPVGIDSKVGGEVTFSAESANLSADCKIILEDKMNKTFTDLSKSVYTTTVSANSSTSDRFRLHTSDQTTGLDVIGTFDGKLSAYAVRNTEIHVKGEVSKQAIATLYDVQGRVVLIKNLEEGRLNIIRTPNIRSGIYLLFVQDNKQMQGFKIPVTE